MKPSLSDLYALFFGTSPTGRRSCSEPVQQVVAKDGSIERRHKGKLVDDLRYTGFDPMLAAPYFAPSDAALAATIDADFADLERRIEAFCIAPLPTGWTLAPVLHRDSPAGQLEGVFWITVHTDSPSSEVTASGNARQRRRQIRAWKRQGFTITQTHALTGATITR
jgi:hypothetical protein